MKREDLLGLSTKNDGMADILTEVINQVLDAQCAEQLQAARKLANDIAKPWKRLRMHWIMRSPY